MQVLLKRAISIATIFGIAVTAFFVGTAYISNNNSGGPASWHALSWRAQLYIRKVTGRVPDLSWNDLFEMTRRSGGFSLENIILRGASLDGALVNPFTKVSDGEAGERIFREQCAVCHGANAEGLHAPPLNRPGLKYGDSDLSLYKVLRDGIPNTAMVPSDLPFIGRWQVIGFLRSIQLNERARAMTPRANFPKVAGKQIEAYDGSAGDWLTYSGSLNGWRYSKLAEITPANVSNLRLRWISQFNSEDLKYEATPLAAGNLIFVSVPPASVVAVDAKTGKLIWKYSRSVPDNLPICCGRVNRGLAILGDTLFFGRLDGYLVAINAQSGKEIWQTQVAKPSDGYTMTGAPLVVKDSVVVGVAGGEFGIRGMLAAYDSATGKLRWKFNTIPGPGEFGHDTWKDDSWKTGGGSTWVTGSYDPSLDLLYWGVGNPSPPFSGDGRPNDNLFANSVVALNASTGKLAWHFQFTPHDEHDWDSAQTPILADVLINGISRRVICWPNRNGFYYVLDRSTGEFLSGVPFVEQNWAQGLTATGRPIPSINDVVTAAGRLTKPGVSGGMNWQPAAFDPDKRLIFVPAMEGASVFTKSEKSDIKRGVNGLFLGSGGSVVDAPILWVRALDIATGAKKWEFRAPRDEQNDHSGLLATAGGLVFGASAGVIFALDSETGKEVWHVHIGGLTMAAPISFTLEGQQVIAVLAGQALVVFGL